jgi:hypothetical protein
MHLACKVIHNAENHSMFHNAENHSMLHVIDMAVDTTDITPICNLCRNFLFLNFLTSSTLSTADYTPCHLLQISESTCMS